MIIIFFQIASKRCLEIGIVFFVHVDIKICASFPAFGHSGSVKMCEEVEGIAPDRGLEIRICLIVIVSDLLK